MKTQQKFQLLQFAFDGVYVKDSEHETIEQAQNTSAELGSKWFFYPFSVIARGKTIIETGGSWYNVATGECLLSKKFAGKRVKTLARVMFELSKRKDMQGADCETFESELLNS